MNGIEMMSPSDIRPYERNPRRNDDAVEYVANSIREFGFRQPIVVDKDMTIIVGHTRWKAAKKLGLKKVPVLVADDLTPEQVKAYRIADNSVGESSTWDPIYLPEEAMSIPDFDLSDFGLSQDLLTSEEPPPVRDVMTAPFRRAYVLVVSELDRYDEVAQKISELEGMEGVDITYVTKTC